MEENLKKEPEDTGQNKVEEDQAAEAEKAECDIKDKAEEAVKTEEPVIPEDKTSDNDKEPEKDETSEKGEGSAGGKDGAKEEKSGFSWRKDKKEITELKDKNAALTDQLKRQMAEFDNFRKRTDKEKEQMFSMGEKNVIEKMLPVVDNFERGLATIEEEDKDDAFTTGMQKIYQQMNVLLEGLGVKPIECIGKEFDPEFHNAVMQVDSEEYETGTVAQELQKGYMYHDSVLRHSMVGVVK